jgi:hypothetical protein
VRQQLRHVFHSIERVLAIIIRVGKAAELSHLIALELTLTGLVWAISQLVMQRVEQSLNQRVRVLTLEIVLAVVPAAVVVDVWTPLRVVEIIIGWSSEVLLPMRVVAVAPLVLLIDAWAERCLVAVEHELLQWQVPV